MSLLTQPPMNPHKDPRMTQSDTQPNTMAHEAPPPEGMPERYRQNTIHGGGRNTGAQSLLNRLMVLAMPFVPKPIVGQVARRYVAGERVEQMLATVKELNAFGISATVDVLGEFIHHPHEAHATANMYKQILVALREANLDANISVKLTALGLLLDESLCESLMRDLVAVAQEQGNFVRIDMEDSSCTEKTIQLYLALRKDFQNVGIVMQAYLRRTHDDVLRIIDAQAGHFRLCKGIYIEPRWLAYQLPDLINQNYLSILETMIQKGAYVGIATHDERLVWGALQLIRKYNLRRDQYEFQMLLGVDPELRDMLVAAGHHVRIYVPFGKEWYAYCMRRLKENPKIAGYILQNMLKRS